MKLAVLETIGVDYLSLSPWVKLQRLHWQLQSRCFRSVRWPLMVPSCALWSHLPLTTAVPVFQKHSQSSWLASLQALRKTYLPCTWRTSGNLAEEQYAVCSTVKWMAWLSSALKMTQVRFDLMLIFCLFICIMPVELCWFRVGLDLDYLVCHCIMGLILEALSEHGRYDDRKIVVNGSASEMAPVRHRNHGIDWWHSMSFTLSLQSWSECSCLWQFNPSNPQTFPLQTFSDHRSPQSPLFRYSSPWFKECTDVDNCRCCSGDVMARIVLRWSQELSSSW